MTGNRPGNPLDSPRPAASQASLQAWNTDMPDRGIVPKPENQLEFGFLGVRAKARGTLAIIAVTFLVASWMALRALNAL